MKKLFMILAGCLMITSLSAQTISEGTKFVSSTLTNLSFNSVSIGVGDENTSASRFGLQAAGGYAIKDDLAIVAGLAFQSAKEDDTSGNVFGFFVGARYYVVPNVFAGAKLAFANLKYEDAKGNTMGVELNGGYTYFLSDRFAIEPSISYYYGLSNKFEDTDIDLSMFSLNIGFVYYL